MSGLILTITDAGRAALVNAGNTGTNPVLMASVGVSATSFTPTPAVTSLPDEIKRITTIAGEAVADDTMHVTVRDESADIYTVRSFGLYLADGTLFAVYSQANPIMEKSAQALLLLAIDVVFADIEATDIAFGDASFSNPPATTERQGVVELATDAETETGSDAVRAVTPKGLKAAVIQWLNDRFGEGAPSAFIKGLLTSASAAALRTSLEIKSAALKDEGDGKGLDADLLDGQHGSYYANIPARLGFTPWGPSNDGAGSGLDADLLDGQHGAFYLNASNLNAGTVPTARLSGTYGISITGNAATATRLAGDPIITLAGAITGSITFNGGTSVTLNTVYSSSIFPFGITVQGGIAMGADSTLTSGGNPVLSRTANALWFYAGGPSGYIFRNTANTETLLTIRESDGQLFRRGATVWDAANMGAGSGLNADLLDGLHASDFARLADFVASKATNGYCRLPNGMIIQAGRYFQNANSLISVVFPLAFPNLCMGVVTGGTGDADFGAEGNTPTVYSNSVTTGGFQSHNANDNGTTAYFIAFGY